MKTPIAILAVILLASCSPASKLRRAEKLIKKAELQGAEWKIDTVWSERVVFVPETRVDSIVIVKPGDSVVIFKERLEVKIKRLRGDTIFIDAACLPDTIKVNVPTIINREITAKGWLRWWHLLIVIVVGAILGRFAKLVI